MAKTKIRLIGKVNGQDIEVLYEAPSFEVASHNIRWIKTRVREPLSVVNEDGNTLVVRIPPSEGAVLAKYIEEQARMESETN